jgi:hypothetical protein
MIRIDNLIAEYKTLPAICSLTNYGDKKSVLANNKAVKRMYKIVKELNNRFGPEGTVHFQKLLDITEYRTNVWAAVHLLEKLTPDQIHIDKALSIIIKESQGDSTEALGFQYWLKQWNAKH